MSLVILFIILSVSYIVKGKLPFYFDTVTAGQITEEVDDPSSIDIDEENEVIEDITNEDMPNQQQENTNTESNEKKLINDTDDILIVINKKRYLAADYKPNDLVIPNVRFSFDGEHEKKYMKQEAATALEELFNQANGEGIHLFAISGYRSYSTQERLFNNYSDKHGEEEANKFSARPGESEHQTGLAMDVSSQSAGFGLVDEFGHTEEGKWVRDNAHKFGFIIRYLKDKTDITGYNYEPWHIRYVGKDVAENIYSNGSTLEEYFGLE